MIFNSNVMLQNWRRAVPSFRTPTSFYLSEWYGRIMFDKNNVLTLSSHFHNGDSRILRIKPNSWNSIMPDVNMADMMCPIMVSILNSLAWCAKWCQMSLDTWSSFLHPLCVMRTNQSSHDWLVRLLKIWVAHEFFLKKNIVWQSYHLLDDGCRIFDPLVNILSPSMTIGEIRTIYIYRYNDDCKMLLLSYYTRMCKSILHSFAA